MPVTVCGRWGPWITLDVSALIRAPPPPRMPASPEKLQALAAKWADAGGAERAHFHSYLIELADALGVERPGVSGSGYEFEYPLRVGNRDGTESQNFIDLLRRDHFVLEAKDSDPGTAADLLMRKAFGQARNYAMNLPGTPVPYVMVMDVGKTLMLWDR